MEKLPLEEQIEYVQRMWLHWKWRNERRLYTDAEHSNKYEEKMFYEILQSLNRLKDLEK